MRYHPDTVEGHIEIEQMELFRERVKVFLDASRFLGGSETKVLMNLMVLSAGTADPYRNEPESVTLSLNELMTITDLVEGSVRRALHGLERAGLIGYTHHSNRIARTYTVDHEAIAKLAAPIIEARNLSRKRVRMTPFPRPNT